MPLLSPALPRFCLLRRSVLLLFPFPSTISSPLTRLHGSRFILSDRLLEQKLQEELALAKSEIEAARKGLEETKEREVQVAKKRLQDRYEGQITTLQAQLNSLTKSHTKIVNEVAKRPHIIAEIVADREKQLSEEIEKTQKERQALETLQHQMEEDARRKRRELDLEAQRNQEQWQQKVEQTLKTELATQREVQELRLKKTEDELKVLYARKDQEHRIKAENTIRGLLSHGIKSLAETQQIIDHIVSPALLKSVRDLGSAHHESLLWAIRSMSEALDQAEQKLVDGDATTYVEGGRANGHQQHSSDDFLK